VVDKRTTNIGATRGGGGQHHRKTSNILQRSKSMARIETGEMSVLSGWEHSGDISGAADAHAMQDAMKVQYNII
jgi:hypothetical protein